MYVETNKVQRNTFCLQCISYIQTLNAFSVSAKILMIL